MRDRYGAQTAKAQSLRFHTQTAGVSLTAQQPYNNVVRTAVEALAAVLGGTNSLHTNALDETLALPTEESAEIALRTQQVLAEETGVINVADPLGGSWYVEALTDKIEAEAVADPRPDRGAWRRLDSAARDRPDHLRTAAWHRGRLVHRTDRGLGIPAIRPSWRKATRRSSGSTSHTGTVTRPLEILRVSHEVEVQQCASLSDSAGGPGSMRRSMPRSRRLIKVARSRRGNMIEPMLAAARAEATLGEICDALRAEWGEYVEPARF